jgi:hypothetical protein
MYRLPNKIIRPLVKKFELRGLNDWWVKLGQKMSTPTKPIYNLRGSIANLEVVPLLGINGFALGLLQDADPVQMGLYRAGDYGTAYFFQHKIQHLLKIDSVVGTVTGYALGIPACIFGLPMIFPSLIHKAPGLSKEDTGYFASLAKDDFETANESLKTSISSYTFLHNVPVLGALWNKVSPLGSVEDSNWMIEDKGALAFWNQMLEKTDLAEKEVEVGFAEEGMPYPDNDSHAAVNTPVDTPNLKILSGFIKKVVEDDQKYFFEGGLPEDPATLRLHLLELALLKAIINNRNYPFIRNMAAEMARPIEPILQNIPLIASEEELRRFANNLNVNKIAGINNK